MYRKHVYTKYSYTSTVHEHATCDALVSISLHVSDVLARYALTRTMTRAPTLSNNRDTSLSYLTAMPVGHVTDFRERVGEIFFAHLKVSAVSAKA